MKIFLTQKQSTDRFGALCDILERTYIEFFAQTFPRASLFVLPNHLNSVKKTIAEVSPDLIVLTGSNNLPASAFADCTTPDDLAPQRDEVESFLFEYALSNGCPTLGICRGLQFLNWKLGGKSQKIPSSHAVPGDMHPIVVEEQVIEVNSFHNFCVAEQHLAPDCQILGIESNRVVEAFKATPGNSRLLALQWHPEREAGAAQLSQHLMTTHLGLDIQ